mmetsp:Transcript_40216/g.114994  ORF Transcript_40216/g.114994 Transcript_40216/m.114994 type:complete len:174 (-) Transcript_40216:93-614(-)
MATEDVLAALSARLASTKEARGLRGGLGHAKAQPGGVGAANDKFARTGWGAVFSAHNAGGQSALPKKWAPAGEDPLYQKFTRGPVLGGSLEEVTARVDASAWRQLAEAVLQDAGGALAWPELRDEVVKRRRTEAPAAGGSGSEALWPHLALAHIPESFLSREDHVVRLRTGAK